MLRSIFRLVARLVATVLVGAAALVAVAVPAHADPVDGILLVKGAAGNAFTADEGIFQGVVPGKAAKKWSFRVVNTTSTEQTYAVGTMGFASFGADITISYGGSTRHGVGNFYYVTLLPGKSATLKVKVGLPVNAAVDDYFVAIQVRDSLLSDVIDEKYAVAVATYQDGNNENDAFIKTGNQPYVGGDLDRTASSQALKVGQAAKFSMKIVNNSPAPAHLYFYGGLDGCSYSEFQFAVKKGSTTLTEDQVVSGYDLGVVAPSKKVTLTLRMKLIAPTDCTSTTFYLGAEGPSSASSLQSAHVPIAYVP